jgi:hypothetical protein
MREIHFGKNKYSSLHKLPKNLRYYMGDCLKIGKIALLPRKLQYKYVPQEGTKYTTGRHTMCHRKAQNVPQEGTKCATGRHKMCHRKAQNVPHHGTKRLIRLR